MIKPTVGRVVWFHPEPGSDLVTYGDEPIPATVCCVWSDTCVNVAGHDANGNAFARTSVTLLQGDEVPPETCYVEWMPYQKQQASAS